MVCCWSITNRHFAKIDQPGIEISKSTLKSARARGGGYWGRAVSSSVVKIYFTDSVASPIVKLASVTTHGTPKLLDDAKVGAKTNSP